MNGIRFARIPARAARMNLGAIPFRVLIAISSFADADGRAYPGMSAIAEAAGIRRKDVPRAVAALVAYGLLKRDRSVGGSATTNYIVVFNNGEVSAGEQTAGVRTTADRVSASQQTGCPQGSVQGVRITADQTDINRPTNRLSAHLKRRVRQQIVAADVIAQAFESFWRAYPSRGSHANPKKPARERFGAAAKRGVDPQFMVRAAKNYADAMHRSGTAGRYIKTAEVWLIKESWEQYGTAEEPVPLRAGMI
jgi:hypothetical protein